MKRNGTMIVLISDTGLSKPLSIEHADGLLRLRNTRWSIPKDSEFKFSVKDGITRRTDKKDTGKSTKDASDKQSVEASGLD